MPPFLSKNVIMTTNSNKSANSVSNNNPNALEYNSHPDSNTSDNILSPPAVSVTNSLECNTLLSPPPPPPPAPPAINIQYPSSQTSAPTTTISSTNLAVVNSTTPDSTGITQAVPTFGFPNGWTPNSVYIAPYHKEPIAYRLDLPPVTSGDAQARIKAKYGLADPTVIKTRAYRKSAITNALIMVGGVFASVFLANAIVVYEKEAKILNLITQRSTLRKENTLLNEKVKQKLKKLSELSTQLKENIAELEIKSQMSTEAALS